MCSLFVGSVNSIGIVLKEKPLVIKLHTIIHLGLFMEIENLSYSLNYSMNEIQFTTFTINICTPQQSLLWTVPSPNLGKSI